MIAIAPDVETARRQLVSAEDAALQAGIELREAYSRRHAWRSSVQRARKTADYTFTVAVVAVIRARSELRAISGERPTDDEIGRVRIRWAMIHGTPHEHLMRADYEDAVSWI